MYKKFLSECLGKPNKKKPYFQIAFGNDITKKFKGFLLIP